MSVLVLPTIRSCQEKPCEEIRKEGYIGCQLAGHEQNVYLELTQEQQR